MWSIIPGMIDGTRYSPEMEDLAANFHARGVAAERVGELLEMVLESPCSGAPKGGHCPSTASVTRATVLKGEMISDRIAYIITELTDLAIGLDILIKKKKCKVENISRLQTCFFD